MSGAPGQPEKVISNCLGRDLSMNAGVTAVGVVACRGMPQTSISCRLMSLDGPGKMSLTIHPVTPHCARCGPNAEVQTKTLPNNTDIIAQEMRKNIESRIAHAFERTALREQGERVNLNLKTQLEQFENAMQVEGAYRDTVYTQYESATETRLQDRMGGS